MTQAIRPFALVSAVALLAACSAPARDEAPAELAATQSAAATTDDTAMAEAQSPAATPSAPADVLRLEGLGDLVIGAPVPAGSRFAERGAQIEGGCRTVSSPDYPGVYALVEDGEVRRITLGERSQIRLAEGIGSGSSEAEVRKAFPGFVASQHKYVEAPGKYLTQPGGDPRLRFEIGADRKVSLVHVGLEPQLGYVEGCA